MRTLQARHPKAKRGGFIRWFMQVGWKHIVGLAVIVFATFPLVYILSTSLTKMGNIENFTLFRSFYLGNYTDLLKSSDYPFVIWMKNTLILAGATAVISVFISALAAFAFSRLRFTGRRPGLLALILIQMFPSILGLTAVFGILSKLTDYVPAIGLGTKAGLILVYLGGSLGGGTYLLYGFFNSVPKELDEAAKIDGATHTQIFPSKSEARKMLQANGFAFNKDKYTDVDGAINTDLLMHNRYRGLLASTHARRSCYFHIVFAQRSTQLV